MRVSLSGEDVDALRRVAPFAEQNPRVREVLSLVHIYDGLAYATDAYRIAFAEVECRDFYFPAQCAEWLPLDGVDLDVVDRLGTTTVTWETENGTVGGSYRSDSHFVTAGEFASIFQPKSAAFCARGCVAETPRYAPVEKQHAGTAFVATPNFSHVAWLNHGSMMDTLKRLDDDCSIAFSDKPLRPVWFWDDEMTVLMMPVRPLQDIYLDERAA